MGLVFCHDWPLKTAKDAATKTECACVCVLEMLLLELLAKTFHSLQAPVWNDDNCFGWWNAFKGHKHIFGQEWFSVFNLHERICLGPNPKPSSTRIRNANQFLCNQHQVLSFKFTSAHGPGQHIYYNNMKLKMFKTFWFFYYFKLGMKGDFFPSRTENIFSYYTTTDFPFNLFWFQHSKRKNETDSCIDVF